MLGDAGRVRIEGEVGDLVARQHLAHEPPDPTVAGDDDPILLPVRHRLGPGAPELRRAEASPRRRASTANPGIAIIVTVVTMRAA